MNYQSNLFMTYIRKIRLPETKLIKISIIQDKKIKAIIKTLQRKGLRKSLLLVLNSMNLLVVKKAYLARLSQKLLKMINIGLESLIFIQEADL